MLLYVHRNRRLIRDGSPGLPPRLSHSSRSIYIILFFFGNRFLLPLRLFCSSCAMALSLADVSRVTVTALDFFPSSSSYICTCLLYMHIQIKVSPRALLILRYFYLLMYNYLLCLRSSRPKYCASPISYFLVFNLHFETHARTHARTRARTHARTHTH